MRLAFAIPFHQRAMDEMGIFQVPVLETYPQIADTYLERVEQPMDFRTIEEERLHYYKSIRELQDDLILTFENCKAYNGALSEYGLYAE